MKGDAGSACRPLCTSTAVLENAQRLFCFKTFTISHYNRLHQGRHVWWRPSNVQCIGADGTGAHSMVVEALALCKCFRPLRIPSVPHDYDRGPPPSTSSSCWDFERHCITQDLPLQIAPAVAAFVSRCKDVWYMLSMQWTQLEVAFLSMFQSLATLRDVCAACAAPKHANDVSDVQMHS